MRGRKRVHSINLILAAVTAVTFLRTTEAGAQPEPAAHHDREKTIDLKVGAALGGAPFLAAPGDGLVRETTADWSAVAFARLRFPKISPRSLELYTVFGKGYGLHIRNDDLHIGRVRLHLFDLGVFWAAHEPVTASRVRRDWDLSFGLGAEIELTSRISLTADWRTFMPLNIFRVLTENGDYSRLIGEEVLRGGQAWLGALYRF